MTEEGQEGRNAFNQKRQPDFSKFKRNPHAWRAGSHRWQIPMDAGVVLRDRRLKLRDGLYVCLRDGEREGWEDLRCRASVRKRGRRRRRVLTWVNGWLQGRGLPECLRSRLAPESCA